MAEKKDDPKNKGYSFSDSDAQTSGVYLDIATIARNRIEAKRKRKGLGELKAREKSVYGQFGQGMLVSLIANTAVAPLERTRIVLQTRDMAGPQFGKISSGSMGVISQICKDQGSTALWRGNMPLVYQHSIATLLRVILFDRVKNKLMPFNENKYTGFDYFWRIAASGVVCQGATLLVTYPMGLIHTRMCADYSSSAQKRLYLTTFDCFNRTNLDETRNGLYKGWQFAIPSAVIRSVLTLPLYSFVKSKTAGDGNQNQQDSSFGGRFVERASAALVSALLISSIVYPLDTCMRLMMVNGGKGFKQPYNGALACIKAQMTAGGTQLYRGLPLYLIAQTATTFLQFSIYDYYTATPKAQ